VSTLYIDRIGAEIRQDGGALALYVDGARETTVPIALLDQIVIRGNVALSTGVLGILAEAGVGVLMLSGRYGRRMAQLVGPPNGRGRVRIGQYHFYLDTELRLQWSRGIVAAKLTLQRRLLEQALAHRPDLRHPLTQALRTLAAILEQVEAPGSAPAWDRAGSELASLMGLEGAAAAAYFAGYATLFPPSLDFHGRNRRPPRDPVNACLSLAYTLLHAEAVQRCHGASLDPMIGFYHALAPQRESLASDLIEALRPRVDAWVYELFRTRRLRAEHFSKVQGGACLLDKGGRAIFYHDYEQFAPPLRRLLRRRCSTLARQLDSLAVLSAPFPDDHSEAD
jgi:CRISP-associated protein Cas1